MFGQTHGPSFPFGLQLIELKWIQANYRRTNVATKLKVTYVKDSYLNVCLGHFPVVVCGVDSLLQVQIHHKACMYLSIFPSFVLDSLTRFCLFVCFSQGTNGLIASPFMA